MYISNKSRLIAPQDYLPWDKELKRCKAMKKKLRCNADSFNLIELDSFNFKTVSPFYCYVINCIAFKLPSLAEKDGGEIIKLLVSRMSKLWPFIWRDARTKQKGTTSYVFMVLSDSFSINAIKNGILQRIIWR